MNTLIDMESPVSNPQHQLFSFFEMTPDLVCVVTKEGFFKEINNSVIEKLGYTKKELMSKPVSAFIFSEDVEKTGIKRDSLLNGSELINFENRYVTKSGGIIWLYWTSFYNPDLEVVFAIAKDITERKFKEKRIEEKYKKFKNLTQHFKNSIEKEKKYFSVELHEEVAQLASVIKMDLYHIKNNIPDLSEYLKSRLEHASDISSLLIQTIRKIAFEISPYMLNEFGLNETLKLLCNDFTILYEIPCYFISDYDEKELTHEIKMDFFRICQESLSNVIKHASAHSVTISIKDLGNELRLSIRDDGKGFEFEKQLRKSGLINIRERVASINGNLTIKSEIQNGTHVSITIPKKSSAVLINQD